MKLISIKQGLYPGYIRDYNIKTSDRTGKKYLNLNLLIDTFKQEADVQKSYCLDIGYNLSIIELMEEVGGLDKSGNADFEKLYDHEFMVGMADKYEYVNTPTECLNELKHIALQKGIDKSTLPKDGSRLTKALILIRDELSEVYGLDFEQKRGKERLYVITNKNLEEEFDEE